MISLEDVIRNIRAARTIPGDEDLRKLPHGKAFIYGRVSSAEQVRQSLESIRDIARLVEIAKRDGYKTSLDMAEVEKWLQSIQNGENVSRIIEDGDIIIDCRDLGISGSLDEDKRPGLGNLWRGVENDQVGAVYLTEGMSRLSRDRDRILGYKLLKLLKVHKVRIRTPEGIYNPAISRDWENLAEDVEKSAEEMKKMGVRLGWRRKSKATAGRHVGTPVCPGFIVEIEGQRNDGSYIMGRWLPYAPHKEVILTALQELVRQRSVFKAVRVLYARGVVFPFFPQELKYMETRSALRLYRKNDKGYIITTNTLKTLATSVALVGTWQWKDILIENNHPAIVPEELFLQAYEIATSHKPRGRAAYSEPMEWANLLYCCNHETPLKVAAYNTSERWACNHQHHLGLGPACLYIEDHLLTPPLTRAFLDCLDLTPHAQSVLEKLKTEVSEHSLEETKRRQRESELKAHIANLEKYLGCGDPEREETYWRLIKEARAELQMVRQKPTAPESTVTDIEKVAGFMENLEGNWQKYPRSLRNHLIALLIDRVELRHNRSHVEATIVWKVGFRQVVNIRRPSSPFTREKVWTAEDDNLLRMLWPSSSWETLQAAFPGRTQNAIELRAWRFKLKRQDVPKTHLAARPWTQEETIQLREMYASGESVAGIAKKLGRNESAVLAKLARLGLRKPEALRHKRSEPVWEAGNFKVTKATCSQKRRPP